MIAVVITTNRREARSEELASYYHSLLVANTSEEVVLVDLKDLPRDFVVTALYENAGNNKGFNQVKELIQKADKYVFIVPEYNGSYPGVFKSFIDGLDYPSKLKEKPVALVGLSIGDTGAGPALSHLTDVFFYLGAHVLPQRVRLPKINKVFKNGAFAEQFYADMLLEQVKTLIK